MTTNNIWNWIGGIARVAAISGVTYLATTNPDASKTKAPTTTSPTITVSTTNAVPLALTGSVNPVDIYFVGSPSKANIKNLLDPKYSSLVKALGYTNIVYPSISSISRYCHQKDGMGYVGQPSDFPTKEEYEAYGKGVLVAKFTQGFSSNNIAFTKAMLFNNDCVLNIKNGNQSQHQAMLKVYNPQFVVLGAELQTSGMSAKAYVDSCNKIIPYIRANFPKAFIFGNATIMRRGNPASFKWNDSISGLAVDGFINYNQPGDVGNFTTNQDSNILKLQNYFTVQIPYEDSMFNSYFNKPVSTIAPSSIKKEGIGEWMLEDNRAGTTQYINRKITGIYGLGMFYQSFISRNSLVNYIAWMSLGNLVDDQNNTDVNYAAIKMLNKTLGAAKSITTVTFNSMAGVSGISEVDGKTTTILINNSSSTTYSPTLTIDGKNKTGTFILQRQYSSDGTWYGRIQTDSISSATIIAPACGFTIVQYTNK